MTVSILKSAQSRIEMQMKRGNQIKQILAVLMSLMRILSSAACGSKASVSEKASASLSPPPVKLAKKRVKTTKRLPSLAGYAILRIRNRLF